MSDAVIVGGGVAGLAAAVALTRAGAEVDLVEARERLGGRIWSVPVQQLPAPIELGAEFIHGRPREIFEFVTSQALPVVEAGGTMWRHEGELVPVDENEAEPEAILRKIDTSAPDRSFQDFVAKVDAAEDDKRWAAAYVEGFHAADTDRISVHSLARGLEAEERNDGHLQFRPQHGYENLVMALHATVRPERCHVHLGAVVRQVHWEKGGVRVVAHVDGKPREYAARAAIVALPLGVLQASPGDIAHVEIVPELRGINRGALQWLVMGPVVRVSLVFNQEFWQERAPDMSFLFSRDRWFPTWWWAGPSHGPVLTGWAAGLRGSALTGRPQTEVITRAIESLARLMGRRTAALEQMLVGAYTHDWQSDPYARGAYSWARVGGADAFAGLARPVEDTLFFAGEATDNDGHNGTVHGAMASGYRAAREVLGILGKR